MLIATASDSETETIHVSFSKTELLFAWKTDSWQTFCKERSAAREKHTLKNVFLQGNDSYNSFLYEAIFGW